MKNQTKLLMLLLTQMLLLSSVTTQATEPTLNITTTENGLDMEARGALGDEDGVVLIKFNVGSNWDLYSGNPDNEANSEASS